MFLFYDNLGMYYERSFACEEDKSKNKAQRAWTGGPNGPKSMGPREVKPIPCIEHYLK